MKTSVLGAGPWGTAVACLLKRNCHDVKLWAFQGILDKDIRPIDGIDVTDDMNNALQDSDYVFIVLNSHFFISTLELAAAENLKNKKFIVLTKGLVEFEGCYLLSYEILTTIFHIPEENIAVLSGPNVAAEIYRGHPAAAVVASKNPVLLQDVKNIIQSPVFKIETSSDTIGVQWSGILKNPVAVGVGICDGLFSGSANPKSALIVTALNEMQMIGKYFGANEVTFTGLAGIGDLITTCLAGRNQKVGLMLAQGKTLDEIYSLFAPQKPEGPEQIKIIHGLIKDKVKAPLFSKLFNILYSEDDPRSIMRLH